MATGKTKHRKAPRRAVRAGAGDAHRLTWPHFERVSASRLRLKIEHARTLYAVLHLLSDEYVAQLSTLTAAGVALDPAKLGNATFLRHAASAYRMAADRLLKSFTLDAMILAERYSGEQFAAAVESLNRNHAAPAA